MEQTNKVDPDNDWVCFECGNRYIREANKRITSHATTAHTGTCTCCGEEKTVVHIRNYGWLYNWTKTE